MDNARNTASAAVILAALAGGAAQATIVVLNDLNSEVRFDTDSKKDYVQGNTSRMPLRSLIDASRRCPRPIMNVHLINGRSQMNDKPRSPISRDGRLPCSVLY